jgi:CRISPR-associated protein Cas6
MFWEEDDKPQEFQLTDEVLDLSFSIQCRELEVDHAYALGEALTKAAPMLKEDPRCAVHSIHLAGSQNGWERPDPNLGQKLILSRRTRLVIRTPRELADPLQQALDGVTLDIHGDPLTIGKAKRKLLSRQGTIFARHVVLEAGEEEDENRFMLRIAKTLKQRGIPIKKALCGITQDIRTPHGPLHARSIMLADLSTEHSVHLQQQGIGEHGLIGCGIFIPHKGIDAVKKAEDE